MVSNIIKDKSLSWELLLKLFKKYHETIYDSYDVALFVFFTVILVIVLFTFYCSCHYSCIVFVLFMAMFSVHFSFYCWCHYSCIVFLSLYKTYELVILGRRGKTGRLGRVNRVAGQNGSFLNGSIGLWVGLGWPVFLKQVFFFIFFIFFFSITKTNQWQPVWQYLSNFDSFEHDKNYL